MSVPAHISESVDEAARIGVRDLFLLAVGLGLAAGLANIAVVFVRHNLLGAFTFTGSDLPWMTLIGFTLVLLSVGAPFMVVVAITRQQIWGVSAAFTLILVGSFGIFLHATVIHPWALLALAAGTAARSTSVIRTRPKSWRRHLTRATQLLLTIGILIGTTNWLSPWLRERRMAAPPIAGTSSAPNILLIILDTVRAASMSLYGYERQTTPNLEIFAEGGAVFDYAIAPSPWTLPSHASLFTERWPSELSAGWYAPLDEAQPTLGEVLRSHGYRTGGFVANTWYAAQQSGLDRGFDRYMAFRRSFKQVVWSTTLTQTMLVRRALQTRSLPTGLLDPSQWRWIPNSQVADRKWAPQVSREFLAWLDGTDGQPFFAFLNYFDAHDPYWPPEPWRTRFAPEPSGQDSYDGAIALIDNELGGLFDQLERRGVLENTIVVITSDHGEHFGEHGLNNHGGSLYLPVLHVPLVIRFPTKIPAQSRVRRPVSLRDLGPTIIALADLSGGLESDPSSTNLFGLPPVDSLIHQPVLAEVEKYPGNASNEQLNPASRGEMRAVFLDRWHYILNGDGIEEVYNFFADPAEANNLLDSLAGSPLLEQLRTRAREYP